MLETNQDLTQREPQKRLEVSTSGINYYLKTLVELVKVQSSSQLKNKFGYIFVGKHQGGHKGLLWRVDF
jgi:predicted HTH transcriptional regulator